MLGPSRDECLTATIPGLRRVVLILRFQYSDDKILSIERLILVVLLLVLDILLLHGVLEGALVVAQRHLFSVLHELFIVDPTLIINSVTLTNVLDTAHSLLHFCYLVTSNSITLWLVWETDTLSVDGAGILRACLVTIAPLILGALIPGGLLDFDLKVLVDVRQVCICVFAKRSIATRLREHPVVFSNWSPVSGESVDGSIRSLF